MSERRSSGDLGPNLEALLSSFPVPERDWENDALAMAARLSQIELGSTDAALLSAPLPSEAGEPTAPLSATATPLTHSGVRTQSLADLARRSVENKQAAAREMARESLALAAQRRPKAEEVLALREAMSSKMASALSPTPTSAAPAAVAASANRAPATNSADSWPKLGLGAAALALAAGALFWLRQPAPAPLASSVVPTPTSEAKASTSASVVAQSNVASGIDPNSLPGESAAKSVEARDKPAGAMQRSAAASAPSAAPHAEKIVLEDEPASAAPAAAAPVEKALPADPALRPADSTSGELPAKPSTGAVQAALGAVMSGARHCVAGDDAPSSATVVFGSDGRVQSVSVSGPASGQPSGACIQAQLGRARVQPFAAANFSVSATVRPD